jgi:hypothetical protein
VTTFTGLSPLCWRATTHIGSTSGLGQSRRFDSAPVIFGLARPADIFNVRRHLNPNLATLE